MKTIFTLIFSALIVSASAQSFTWTAQSSGTTELLNDLYFVDNQTGWAVGDNGTIVATVDGGETWTAQTSGTDRKLRSVFFLDQDTGWVAGGESPLIVLHTVNGGTDWETLTVTAEPTTAFFNKIEFADALHGYAINGFDIYHTEDGGNTWTVESYGSTIAGGLNVRDIQVLSDTSAFACGKYTNELSQTRPGVFDNLANNTNDWRAHGVGSFDTDDELTAIVITDAQKGFAGGMNGKIYSMVADGTTFPGIWETNFDSQNGWVWSMDFSDNDHGIFNVSTEVEGVNIQLIYHTSDAGANWSAAPDSISGLLSATLFTPDTENAWIAGSEGQIFKGARSTTSAFDHSAIEFSVMPNPFYSSVLIKSPEVYNDVQLNMFNYTGQLVESVYVGDFQYEYEFEGLDHLESGVYFLQMKSADGSLNATQKVLKY